MKAVRVHATGDAGVLRVEDVPVPEPGPGQALVQIEAVGLNFIDVYHRTGLYKVSLPATLGSEAAGTVEAVGPGVTTVRAGDRVASVNLLGAYAEYALACGRPAGPAPRPGERKQAAARDAAGDDRALPHDSTFPLERGHTCLVHAAAGGVGLLLCQMAKRRGARVIGTVSTQEKAALAREAGADDVILYTQTDFETEVKRLTDGAGVHVNYDSVGRTTSRKASTAWSRRGMMVLCGQSSGPVEPFDPQILNQKGSLFLTRPTLGALHREPRRAARAGRRGAGLGGRRLAHRADRGGVPPRQAADAQRELEGRRTTGKVLLIP